MSQPDRLAVDEDVSILINVITDADLIALDHVDDVDTRLA